MLPMGLERVLFDESVNVSIREALPEPVITAFELLTHLGDGATLVFVMAVMYWFGAPERRRDRALVLGIGLLALAVSAGLKGVVDASRPDVAFGYGTYSPYSFPSAHALGAAAVYGGIAAYGDVGSRSWRYAAAGGIVAAVALSRVVVGAHFPGDVLAGVALGFGIVATVRVLEPDPSLLFVLAGTVALVSFAFGSTHYTTVTTGAAIGAVLTWPYARRQSWAPYGASLVVLAVCLVPVVVAVRAITVGWSPPWYVAVGAYAGIMGTAVVVPGLGERLNGHPVVERLQSALPICGRTVDVPDN